MNVAIIDYNSGNIQNVIFALQRLGVEGIVTHDIELIRSSDKIIFPGVGHASAAMESLKETGLDKLIPDLKQPFLGICAGMQLMCNYSEEGNVNCLNIFPMKVKRFPNSAYKVPHTGWNTIDQLKSDLFEGVMSNEFMYFVHSYYVETSDYTTATCNYINNFSAAIHTRNFYGVQFHAELSAQAGSRILSNFLKLRS